jgi:hypothetical protein
MYLAIKMYCSGNIVYLNVVYPLNISNSDLCLVWAMKSYEF